ncbi:MAG: hypothetical protein OEN55_18475 [Alphaproteobacteria bacterium]|nr:hypothetical protein [Alphaproteobacteria bacterium]
MAAIVLAFAIHVPQAMAADKPAAEIEAIRAGLEEAFDSCHHWGGEEPYDDDRAGQIRRGYERDCPVAFASARAALAALPDDPKVAAIIIDLEDYIGPYAFEGQRVVVDDRTKKRLCANAASFYGDPGNRGLRFTGYFEEFCPAEAAILPAR